MSIFDRRRVLVAALAAPIAALAACTPDQPPSSTPGTVPPVWTGAPAPVEVPEAAQPGSATDSLTAFLESPDGKQIARATFDFRPQYVTVTIQTTGVGNLSPGFHAVHIHAVGKCEANSAPPGGGATGDFLSAGGHFQAPGHNEHPHSGDLTSLHVRTDGGGLLVTTTDEFTKEELLAGDGTVIIIHDGDDNFGNIPTDRYTQINGTPGPDQTTLATGDAGKRAACGVIGKN